jgi:HlyD family secretion protein
MSAVQPEALRLKREPESLAPEVLAPAHERESKTVRPRKRRAWYKGASLLLLGALITAAAIAWRSRDSGGSEFVTAPVTVGDIVRQNTASGMVNPVETVQIGSYVSGRIEELSCDYNTAVVKGQRCAKIDPRSYQAAVEQATAAVGTANAQLNKDQANLAYAKVTYERNLALLNRNVVSQDAADNALNSYKQTQAQVALDQATISQREAELKSAQVNLDYTDIVSPVNGTVVSRSVAIGQTVTANFQTPTLFLIATDLTKMQVDANVSEAEIGGVKEGQKATFTVEAFPNRTFTGKVAQIRLAPVSVQNVISYDVVIDADNPDLALKPGMTATTHIVAAEKHDVLRIPEAALRFVPNGHTVGGANAAERTGGRVWVRRGGGLEPVALRLGLADEDAVEVTGGAIHAGDEVVIGRRRPGEGSLPAAANGASGAS